MLPGIAQNLASGDEESGGFFEAVDLVHAGKYGASAGPSQAKFYEKPKICLDSGGAPETRMSGMELTHLQKKREAMRHPRDGHILGRRELADVSGTTARSIENYEKRKSRCASMAVRKALAYALGVNVTLIFDKDGNARVAK